MLLTEEQLIFLTKKFIYVIESNKKAMIDSITYYNIANSYRDDFDLYLQSHSFTEDEIDLYWDQFYFNIIVNKANELFVNNPTSKKNTTNRKQNKYRGRFGFDEMLFYSQEEINKSFEFFNLNKDVCTETDVIQEFKKLCFVYHPDHGGNEEEFKNLIKMRNICITYLTDNKTESENIS